jgi:dienelactone hydrolase
MDKKRREFLKQSSQAGLCLLSSSLLNGVIAASTSYIKNPSSVNTATTFDQMATSIIGLYGSWAASLTQGGLPSLSLRRNEWTNVDAWRKTARKQLLERMAVPHIAGTPKVTIHRQYTHDGLQIEELSWQLPYGRPTEAILLKPLQQKEPLPGVLAFHDHGGNKYFGKQKITRTANEQHLMMKEHQQEYYSGKAWANELAKRGYVVLVPDAFTFGSRRVQLQDVPQPLRNGLNDPVSETADHITAYNQWAGDHEHIMAKSLFSAGTTWPGVFFAEDQKALDVLCARKDVDANRVGCGGLSGGGIRTVYMGGIEPRIKCAIPVGFMTTWTDFLLNKSFTHTWMTYVPLLPNELDFPEILGLRTPLPAFVLNNNEDTLFTLPEMKKADAILADVYKKAHAENRYKCSFYPGPHKFDAAMQAEAFDWFDKWLKHA